MTALRTGAEAKEKMCLYLLGKEKITGRYCPWDREQGLQMIRESALAGYKMAEEYLKTHDSEGYQLYIHGRIGESIHAHLQGRMEQIRSEISEYTQNSKQIHGRGNRIDDEIDAYLDNS